MSILYEIRNTGHQGDSAIVLWLKVIILELSTGNKYWESLWRRWKGKGCIRVLWRKFTLKYDCIDRCGLIDIVSGLLLH